MTNSNFIKGQGRLVVDRYDFQKHIEGTDFRHRAIGIDLETPLTALSNADDVQTAFDNLNSYIESLTGAGEGFITIGTGYDTWHAADGSVNFDSNIPPLNEILQPIFDAILADSSYSAAYDRIRFGGIIVIKAGTYIVTDTIDVPPGIIIMGEGWGTKIVNATAINLGLTPPEVDPFGTPKPVFRIKADLNRAVTDTIIGTDAFAFSRKTKICNLMISDNFPEFTQTGDLQYLRAQNISGDTPLISQEAGSALELDNVSAFGRVAFSIGTDISSATTYAIQLDASTAIATGTILSIRDCFMDGFSQPIQFFSIGGTNDYLEVNNCKIRAHGWLDGDGTTVNKNCCISMNDNNAIITSNYFYGNHGSLNTIVNIEDILGSPPVLQGKSKILIASNDFAIDKTSAYSVASNILYSLEAYETTATVLTYGNSLQETDGFSIAVNTSPASAQLRITETATSLSASSDVTITAGDDVHIIATDQITLTGDGVSLTGNAGVALISSTANATIYAQDNVTIDASTGLFHATVGTTAEITAVDSIYLTTNNEVVIHGVNDVNSTSDTGDINLTATAGNISLTTPVLDGLISLDGGLILRLNTLTSTPYTIDSSITDTVILVDLTTIAAATTITLPAPTLGRTIIIKDRDGYAGTYNIILNPRDGYADSYVESNKDGYDQTYSGATVGVGQSFTGDGRTLYKAQFYLSKTGSPSSTMVAKIYAHSGSFGTTGIPTGAALATSDTILASANLTTSFALKDFTFSGANQIRLANGTNYVIALQYSGGSSIARVNVGKDSSSPSHNGNKSTLTGTTWTAVAGEDAIFYVFVSDKIEGIPNAATFSANYGVWTLIGNGTDWSLI